MSRAAASPPGPPTTRPALPPGIADGAASDGIVAVGLRRGFGSVRAVDSVSFQARPGRVTALVGPNGAGKTTLLLMLAGLLVPDAGTLTVAGHDPVAENVQARGRTGWMPDTFGTWDSLTAREVLTTVGAAYFLPPARSRARADELLRLVHLDDLADAPARVLSRGQKQRLGLARALVHDPQVLLLDEPASGLDPRSRVDLRILLRRLASEGRTVLVSSHVLTELDELADDAVFLSRGRTVREASLAAATGERRTWRLRALDPVVLTSWLEDTGVTYRRGADDGPEPGLSAAPDDGSVRVDLDDDESAAELLRSAVLAGVPLVSVSPANGALEQVYLSLEEERR
ncbi:ABC transporter ATP-binding protein [Luteimicrobium sp. NPDC057192]|uniref:ABC transporter ATP-binding protein n=1 Tax=Luteimicrobium sp. NPDC057192 TaxID=3346042 RepID=UPI00362F4206